MVVYLQGQHPITCDGELQSQAVIQLLKSIPWEKKNMREIAK